jgi:hypothetical protein
MPVMPRYVMSEEQQELIAEIAELGKELANRNLDPEDREDLQNEMNDAKNKLRRVVEEDRRQFEQEVADARTVRNERNALIARYRAHPDVRAATTRPSRSPLPRRSPRCRRHPPVQSLRRQASRSRRR